MTNSNTSQVTISNTVVNNNQCVPCMLGCQNCVNNSTCIQCTNGYNLYQSSATNTSTCVKICPSGYYITIDQICAQCPSNCLTCDNLKCYSCSSTTNLYNGKCISSCPAGFYSINSQCLACSPKCATCLNRENNCLSCLGSLSLDSNGNCVQNCNSNSEYFNNVTNQCQSCSSDCLSCSGP
jgi:proprotein convertase subtilisin/kexin type 5